MIGALLLAARVLAAEPTHAITTTGPVSGVIVEQVTKRAAADKAGIQPGDVLLRWNRDATPPANPSAASGPFRSPFEVQEVEVEQAPRGATSIEFVRANSTQRAILSGEVWGLITTPRLMGLDLKAYDEGKKLLAEKHVKEGVVHWNRAAGQASARGDHTLATWFLLRAAGALGRERLWEDSSAAYDLAIAEAKLSPDLTIRCQALHEKGEALAQRDQMAQAIDSLRMEVDLREGVAAASLATANALGRLSTAYLARGDLEEAIAIDQRALALRERLAPGSLAVANSRNALGRKLRQRGQLETAEELVRSSVALYEQLDPDSSRHAIALNNLAIIEIQQGDYQSGEVDFLRVLSIYDRLGESKSLLATDTLNNLGNVAQSRGDIAAAENYHRAALTIRQTLLDPISPRIASAYSNLANDALTRGDLDSADYYIRRALDIDEKIAPDSTTTAHHLGNRAEIAFDREDWQLAETYYERARSILEKRAPESSELGMTLRNLGLTAEKLNNHDAATKLLDAAVALQLRVSPRDHETAWTLYEAAGFKARRGATLEAEHLYLRAIDIYQTLAPQSLFLAAPLHGLAQLRQGQGRLGDAEVYLRRSLQNLDSQSRALGGSYESRARFASEYTSYYRDYIGLLLLMQRQPEAFDALERSRAGSLLSLLAERDITFGLDVPPTLERERRRADAEYERAQGELGATKDVATAADQLERLRELRRKQEEVAQRIRTASPKYAALQYPQPLDRDQTRASLDPGTLLLSFSVGKSNSYLFAVSTDLKRKSRLSVLTLKIGEKDLRESVEAFRTLIEWNKPSPELTPRARSLYDSLLKPAEALIAKSDRLLILPDGPLHTLPWAALARDVKNGQLQYLVEWKPVHTAISATVYAELKKDRRQTTGPPSIEIVGFGDPKYPKLPEKKLVVVKRGDGEQGGEALPDDEFNDVDDAQLRSVARGGFRFEPLPASRREVETIASLYSPKSVAYLGPDATEEKAKSIGKGVPLIHYACHAVVNERFPLDSALVFTIPDKPKEGQDNGLLQAWEIFERVRIDADLVTLSACDSGLGKEMGGEGLIGLTRAFQYAGARTVLASLWKVEDASTGELMKRFYTHLKAGKTKDEALRQAQIDLIYSKDFSQPKDWAAFQLNGDWR